MTPIDEIDLLIDTNIGSYVMSGDPIAERYRGDLEGKTVGISFQALAELWVGQRRQGWSEREFRAYIGGLVEVPYSQEIQELFVRVRVESLNRHKAKQGRKVLAADAWVAATALWVNAPLVTHNERDFRGVSDLRVISYPDEEGARRFT